MFFVALLFINDNTTNMNSQIQNINQLEDHHLLMIFPTSFIQWSVWNEYSSKTGDTVEHWLIVDHQQSTEFTVNHHFKYRGMANLNSLTELSKRFYMQAIWRRNRFHISREIENFVRKGETNCWALYVSHFFPHLFSLSIENSIISIYALPKFKLYSNILVLDWKNSIFAVQLMIICLNFVWQGGCQI